MLVDSTHLDYNANANAWLRARDLSVGEEAVKERFCRFLRPIIGRPFHYSSVLAHYPLLWGGSSRGAKRFLFYAFIWLLDWS